VRKASHFDFECGALTLSYNIQAADGYSCIESAMLNCESRLDDHVRLVL
jgi:hypothetical protein